MTRRFAFLIAFIPAMTIGYWALADRGNPMAAAPAPTLSLEAAGEHRIRVTFVAPGQKPIEVEVDASKVGNLEVQTDAAQLRCERLTVKFNEKNHKYQYSVSGRPK